jgi:hypothetical protein
MPVNESGTVPRLRGNTSSGVQAPSEARLVRQTRKALTHHEVANDDKQDKGGQTAQDGPMSVGILALDRGLKHRFPPIYIY